MIIIACYKCDLKSKCADAINLSLSIVIVCMYIHRVEVDNRTYVLMAFNRHRNLYVCRAQKEKRNENYYYQNVINCLFLYLPCHRIAIFCRLHLETNMSVIGRIQLLIRDEQPNSKQKKKCGYFCKVTVNASA